MGSRGEDRGHTKKPNHVVLVYHVASILLHPRIFNAPLVCRQFSLKVALFVCRNLQVVPRE